MSEPYYNGALYTGGGLAGVAALNMIIYLAFIDGPSMSDIVAFIVGIIGVLAGMQKNKGLLIAYMVLTIIVVIWFIMAVMAFSLLVATCGVVSAIADGMCTTSLADGTSVPYCCNACADSATCETNGCDYVDPYVQQYCGMVPANACGQLADSDVTADWEETTPCSSIDKTACDAIIVAYPNQGVSWESTTVAGGCRDGQTNMQYSAPAVTAASCRTDADADASESCSKSFCFGMPGATTTCMSNQNTDDSGAPYTYDIPAGQQAKGCHAETEGGDTENIEDVCDWVNLIWFTMFLTIVFSIAGSVMGCCVVCCGKGDDKEDSG
jgi:hypothetical protein